jgi:hypothetical protein
VQSLASLALIKHASESGAKGKNLVLAVEEPESHLHPDAIHELRKVLSEISKENQVILTTHNAVLVNKEDIAGNIIVERNKARPSKSLRDIKTVLGVRLGDNLQSAECILVLEGEEDIYPIKVLLSYGSKILSGVLNEGRLVIDSMGGASNLTYKATLLRSILSDYHFYLDNDSAGREAAKAAIKARVLEPRQITYVMCNGMRNSELEDLYASDLYHDHVRHEYNVELTEKNLGTSGVWSDRVKKQFGKQSQQWQDDGSTEAKLKRDLAQLVVANPQKALLAYRRNSFDKLVLTLEAKFKNR